MPESYFQNYIRKHNYSSDYFHVAYERYVSTYPAFPINYYAVDTNNTIWEDDKFRGGSYEKTDVGELSGKKFKKIYELPIFQLSSIQPSMDSGDMGITTRNSLQGTFLIPQIYGLKPTMHDVVDLNFSFKNNGSPSKVLYIISNVEFAHHGDEFNIFKCEIQVAHFEKTDIEKQLSELWRFYEPSKSILPLTNTSILYKMISRSEQVSTNLNTMFHKSTSFYLDKLNL